MRLLLLITDLDLGGTPIVVRELAMRLRSASLHVEVACLKPAGPVAATLREAGIAVTSFEAKRVFDLPRTIRDLTALVRERQIDTVFSFLIHANFVAARASRELPNVRFIQSIQTTQPRPRWHWWLQGRIHDAATEIVVPTESVARRAVERSTVPREKLLVIPNAVDLDAFRGTGVPHVIDHVPEAHATFRIGFLGRLDPVKRVNDLIRSMEVLSDPSITLNIWGDGGMRAKLERVAKVVRRTSSARRITFHGAIADPRIAYANIDTLVLPSDAEGFGLVLIEAMAAGVPVIGTNVDGIRDVIRDSETGLLVPPRNPHALAQAIRRLREDAALRERLVAAARIDVANRFAWPAVLEQYRGLLCGAGFQPVSLAPPEIGS